MKPLSQARPVLAQPRGYPGGMGTPLRPRLDHVCHRVSQRFILVRTGLTVNEEF